MFDYEVIVVGLGAVGSAALYQLARSGVAVLGLDRFQPPHDQGSSHGESRITRLAIGEGEALTPMVRRSHELWRQLEAESGQALLSQCGELIIASAQTRAAVHVENFFATTLAAARRHNIDHELLDAAAIRRRFPQFAVRHHEYGYYEPQAGFLRPERCIRVHLARAEHLGAQIHTGERLCAFQSDRGGVQVITDLGQYHARRLVLAAGAWMPELLGAPLSELFRVTRQMLSWFAIAGDADLFVPGRCPVFIWQLPQGRRNLYGFPAIDGPGGGVKIASEQDAVATSPALVRRQVAPDEIAAFYRDYVAPNLRHLSPQYLKAKSCLYTQTADSGFIIDRHPQCDQALIVSACSGHGFKHSAALGEGIAQWAKGAALPHSYDLFRLERFSRE